MSEVNFISGLPRSGSTLLAAILRQRPRIHAGMSSPVAPLMNSLLSTMGIRTEWSSLIDADQRRRLLRGVLDSYYGPARDDLIFDTNRIWCARLPLLVELFPSSLVIACVRKPQFIMNSFESLFRRQPLLMSRLFTAEQSQNVYSRADALAGPDGVFGLAYRALREAYYGEHADKLILFDYDALVSDPRGTVDELYRAIDLRPFDHDFDDLRFEEGVAFDAHFGLPGLHWVEPQVHARERRMLLPPDLVARFASQDFWNRPQQGMTQVRSILYQPDEIHGLR